MSTVHVSILKKEIIEGLMPALLEAAKNHDEIYYLDCTFGGGGHAAGIFEAAESHQIQSKLKVIGVDQDIEALDRAQERFKKEIAEGRLELIHSRMSEIPKEILSKPIFALLADLGFSSDQIEDSARGLSFLREGPLDMRLDPTRGIPLSERLKHTRETEIANIIFEYGEERYSRRIASNLVKAKNEGSFPKNTLELADLIRRSVPPEARHGRIHPATRTFQAFRIWMNEELEELDSLLNPVILSLRPGGRAAVLSFHSLEDRKVKLAFRERDQFQVITKKPVEPSDEEIKANPRARSAKLRIAERIENS